METAFHSPRLIFGVIEGWIGNNDSKRPPEAEADSILTELLGKIVKPEGLASGRLRSLLERDETLCARFINAANTATVNPAGIPINRLPEALSVVGRARLRPLVMGLALQEFMERTTAAHFRHEVSAFALCAAWMSEAIARRDGKSCDPAVFAVTLLSVYGRLVMASYLALTADGGEAESRNAGSFSERFGVDPLELGLQLFHAGQLLSPLQSCLRARRRILGGLARLEWSPALVNLTGCCEALSATILRREDSEQEFDRAVMRHSELLRPGLRFGSDDFVTILRFVEGEIAAQAGDSAKSLLHTGTYDSLKFRAAGSDALPGEGSTNRDSSHPFRNRHAASPESARGDDVFLDGISQLTELLSEPPFILEQAFGIFIQTVFDGLGLSDVVLFTRRSDKLALQAAQGIGAMFQNFDWREPIIENRKDVFGICLRRREEIWVSDASDADLQDFLPEWLHDEGRVHSLFLLPVDDGEKPFALLFGARRSPGPLAVNMKVLQLLKAMRIHLVTIYRLARH